MVKPLVILCAGSKTGCSTHDSFPRTVVIVSSSHRTYSDSISETVVRVSVEKIDAPSKGSSQERANSYDPTSDSNQDCPVQSRSRRGSLCAAARCNEA